MILIEHLPAVHHLEALDHMQLRVRAVGSIVLSFSPMVSTTSSSPSYARRFIYRTAQVLNAARSDRCAAPVSDSSRIVTSWASE